MINFSNRQVVLPELSCHAVEVQLGQLIKAARERAQITQASLAQQVGVSLRTVGNWERGASVPRNRMGKLEELLGPLTIDEPELPDPVDEAKKRAADSQILFAARVKVMGKKMLSAVERIAWMRNLEDTELETFWERWELLDRDQQLAISRQVDQMLEQEAADWVAEFGNPNQGEEDEEAQQEQKQGARGTEGGGTGEQSGAPNTRAAASAAQSDYELAQDRGPIPSREQQKRHDESYEAQTRDEPAPDDFNQDH